MHARSEISGALQPADCSTTVPSVAGSHGFSTVLVPVAMRDIVFQSEATLVISVSRFVICLHQAMRDIDFQSEATLVISVSHL